MSPLKKQNSFEEKLKEQLAGTEWKPSDALWSRIEQNIDADSFEPALQQKLENYSVEPRKEVWDNVEAQLPDSPRRRGLLWFSALTLVLIAAFSAGYWFSKIEPNTSLSVRTEKNTPMLPPQMANLKVAKNKTATETISASDVAQGNQEATGEKYANSARNKNTGSKIASVQAEQFAETSLRTQKPASGIVVARPKQKTASKSNSASALIAAADKPASRKGLGSGAGSLAGANSNNNGSQNGAGGSSNNGGNNTHPESLNTTPQASGQPIANTTDSQNKGDQSATAKPNPEPKVILESINVNPNPKDTFEENKIVRGSSYIAPEETFTKFSVTAMAGAQMCNMLLSAPTKNVYGNLDQNLALRKEMESPALDFSGSLALNYHFGKNWYVFTGVGITSFKQKVEFAVLPANQTNPPRVQPINQYMNANDSIVAGSTNSFENKYSFTEIPLWLGYQFPSERKAHFELMGGISYARLNLVSAYMPDPSGVGMLIVDDKNAFPGFKNVVFAGIAPGVTFKINSSVELGGLLHAKMALNSMVDNEGWIQQKPVAIGLNFFLRKRF